MKKTVIATFCISLFFPLFASATTSVTLDGHSLTLDDAWAIAQGENRLRSLPLRWIASIKPINF